MTMVIFVALLQVVSLMLNMCNVRIIKGAR